MTTLTLTRKLLARRNARAVIDPAIVHIVSKRKKDSKRYYYSNLKKEVCKAFDIPESLLFTKTRKSKIVNARQVYVYLLRTATVISGGEERRHTVVSIAKHIGFDHSTVCHCMRVVRNYYDTEVFFKNIIDRLQEEIREGRLEMPVL